MVEKDKQHINSILPGAGVGVVVNDNLFSALSIFKKMYKESGIGNEVYTRKEYVKPSVKKRKQRQAAIYRQKRNN